MLKLYSSHTKDLFNKNPDDGVLSDQIDDTLHKHTDFIKAFFTRNQGWVEITEDTVLLDSINKFAKSVKNKYTDIVILGIGGSMLGPKTILDALHYTKSKEKISKYPNIYTLDNIDPFVINSVANSVTLSSTLILVQTKSGGTPETLSQYLYFKSLIENQKLDLKEHFVFVTDPLQGYLCEQATLLQIPSFPIDSKVGGRFSVLTPVGLLISALVDIDIAKMLEGASQMSKQIISSSNTQALELAAIQVDLYKKGKPMNVIMPYSSRLATFASWYVQLLSESIGKEFNRKNEIVNEGITPIPAVGATDQHSQMQLFKEGPNDKLIIFIKVKNHQVETQNEIIFQQSSTKTLEKDAQKSPIDYLKNKTFSQLLEAEFLATRQSLFESSRPSVTIEIDEVNEENLGQLFMFFQFSVAFIGELLNIDAYDQPGVERSKILTKEFLLKV